ncbi:ABC transporter permease [Kaustia mangrovi]|uniref:ABC transporter permease n=1 Tax=Kaustia mangrovi TaxID=2593653 RepID=A0A7S8C3A5_9HYPH|nr:ABC transporter permease [Kaustia mangrovi]QPC42532.1 ABC transporter permease [Kaustia mangrovi]
MVTPRRGRRSGFRIALAIYCSAVFFFLVAPLFVVFPISFSAAKYLTFPPPGFSLQWYESYLNDPAWIQATVTSIKVALGTTALATLLGTAVAFSLVRGRYPGRAWIDRLVAAPIIVPNIIIAVALYGVFARFQLVGEWYGVMVGHTIYAIPFVVLVVGAALRTFDTNQEQAAMNLGASRFTAVRRVTLPQIRPSIVSAAFLAFITSFDELIIALFTSGTNATLPKKMFDNIIFEIDPTIAAVSVLQILLVGVVIMLATRFGVGVNPIR